MGSKTCYKCKGDLNHYNYEELQERFSHGVQEYLCSFCADECNAAFKKSRDKYGIGGPVFTKVLFKFKVKNKIPLLGNVSAMHEQMVNGKRKSLIRLMLIMDIRAVNKYFNK